MSSRRLTDTDVHLGGVAAWEDGIGGGCTALEGRLTPIECDATGRKLPQQDRSHKRWREANGGAQCGKSARCVRRGGDWKRGMVEIVGHSQTKGRDNREPKLQPKPARQSSTLPVGAGGGRLPPATRWASSDRRLYSTLTSGNFGGLLGGR